jgi:transcriptional/translational regulatory protein YebC/TACO1
LVALIEPASDSIDLCTEISCKLRKISENISPSLLVYAERLRNLALDKTYYFLEYLQVHKDSGIVQTFITKKSRELTEMKNKLLDYNKKSLKLQKLLKKCESIDEIQSQVESIKTTNSNFTSPLLKTNIDAELGDLDNMIEQQKVIASEKSMEDLKKYFYSKCLSVKLSYSSRHPAQYIQIPELYNKIVKGNTPLEKWEESIREEFDHPERWVNLKVIPK